VLVKATPDAYTELARSHVLAGKCWNSVAISNGRIYARSTKEGVCLEFAGKE
jgi:outer membrane protein assembly factor BamB